MLLLRRRKTANLEDTYQYLDVQKVSRQKLWSWSQGVFKGVQANHTSSSPKPLPLPAAPHTSPMTVQASHKRISFSPQHFRWCGCSESDKSQIGRTQSSHPTQCLRKFQISSSSSRSAVAKMRNVRLNAHLLKSLQQSFTPRSAVS